MPSSLRMYLSAKVKPVSLRSTMRTLPNAPLPTTRRSLKWLRLTAPESGSQPTSKARRQQQAGKAREATPSRRASHAQRTTTTTTTLKPRPGEAPLARQAAQRRDSSTLTEDELAEAKRMQHYSPSSVKTTGLPGELPMVRFSDWSTLRGRAGAQARDGEARYDPSMAGTAMRMTTRAVPVVGSQT